MKKILLILFSLFTFIAYSQSTRGNEKLETTVGTDMQKNINYNLNKERTILHINSDSYIVKIEVIHRLTSKITTFNLKGKKIKLEVNKLYNGENIIMVYNSDGIINLISINVIHSGKIGRKLVTFKYVESTNTSFGSSKKTGLCELKDIIKKIKKNKFDLKTLNGRKNTLIVYAIYVDGSIELIYKTSKHVFDNIE
jgi:hypothetical protein